MHFCRSFRGWLMHHVEIYKIKNKKKTSQLTGYRLFASGKNPKTGKHKLFPTTWKIPKNLVGKKEIERGLNKAKTEWQEEVNKMTMGIIVFDTNTLFIDYSQKFGDDLFHKEGSFTYYEKWKSAMELFREYLSVYKLSELNKQIIKNFYKIVSKRKFIKRTIRPKRNFKELTKETGYLYELLKERGIGIEQASKEIGINRLTLRLANNPSKTVNKRTVEAICKYFKVAESKYFDIVEEEVFYSEASNAGVRSVLSAILTEAVEDELIDFNPCLHITKKGKMTGRKSIEKEVYNTAETQEFIHHVWNMTDLKKKVCFLLYITKGIRPCEMMGLEWKDFDFTNKCFSIVRNSVYTATFGTRTKGTKSKSSTRILPLDDELIEVLVAYRELWLDEQAKHGDLWEVGIDRLFVNKKGKAMARNTPADWLRKFEAEHGLKHIPPHSLRHSNITFKLNHKINPLVVAGDAGHKDAKLVLERYGHYLSDEARQASEEMNSVFFKKVKPIVDELKEPMALLKST